MYGQLVPEGGGDPIPLLKDKLVIGRRENCDIVLRFSNISTEHCEMEVYKGYWFVNDLNSRNGTRVNGFRINRKRLDPGDKLSIARHDYKLEYSPKELGAEGPPPDEDIYDEILSRSLLEGAGLNRQQRQTLQGRVGRTAEPAASQPPADDPPEELPPDDDETPDENVETAGAPDAVEEDDTQND
jgi:adenylate cyclase